MKTKNDRLILLILNIGVAAFAAWAAMYLFNYAEKWLIFFFTFFAIISATYILNELWAINKIE